MNPSRAPSEQHLGDIQEESLTTLEQLKHLENIIALGGDKVDEAAQLRELFNVKSRHDIFMLETNLDNFSEVNKAHVD